ncbi:MAG: hypothetical protein KJ593_02510 [Candidatus Omnitrophica bacterium]|nr:hypothetical protein [Candidatus Omnitrophota bacterium]
MNVSDKEVIFLLQLEDVQEEAMQKLNRSLTADELYEVKKGVEFGLEHWPEVVRHAIDNLKEHSK